MGYGVAVGVSVGVSVAVGVTVTVGVSDGVEVTVEVGVTVSVCEGVGVNVEVAGSELCRVMRGFTHIAKSSCDVPFARTVKINLTFSPRSALRSTLTG